MRSVITFRLLLWAFLPFFFFSCDKQTLENFQNEPLSDYLPVQTGKYITYRVDSLLFTDFGRTEETHSYLVKHVINAQIQDNLGRPSYRVYRYTNDTTASGPWVPTGTYFITPLDGSIELIEDNLRVIKMHLPISDKSTWKGNTYLAPNPYNTLYSFSNDDDMQDWDFIFDTENPTFTYAGNTYNNVCSVEEDDESFNVPITNPDAYGSYTRAVERYSKNIGLIFREFTMWEYQPNTGGGGGGYQVGFGIKMWMVDHN